MPATPKSLRQPPPRRFENYTLMYDTSSGAGLTHINDDRFLPCSPAISGSNPGASYSDDGYTSPIAIGFDFSFDGITYKHFVASTNGWLALVDPTLGTFNTSEVMNFDFWVNSGIKSTFSSNAILLAPWFDDLRNVSSDPTTILINGSSITAAGLQRINEGMQPPPIALNQTKHSVKYHVDERSTRGRRLIVRWHSLSDFSPSKTLLRFEAVIYENGTIEFRYASKRDLTMVETSAEDATIGVFMPGGLNRFRDFSHGLGYRDTERQVYRYGGAVVNSSYTDTADAHTVSYTVNLKPEKHWPGLNNSGATFVFQPPLSKRRSLPRNEIRRRDALLTLPTVLRTGDDRLGSSLSVFDDRRSNVFKNAGMDGNVVTGTLVNYPSTLQRSFGGTEKGASRRQDLFTGDFEFTASIVKTAIDQYVEDNQEQDIKPFSEHKLFENDPASATDTFFTSGSSVEVVGEGLKQPLKAKTQLRLSLPINFTTAMPGITSSIYYYNRKSATWNIPQNSTYVLDITASAQQPPAGNTKGDLARFTVDSINERVLEDIRGFGPIGNAIASGSRPKTGKSQSDTSIGSFYSIENTTIALGKSYAKSVTNNEEYRATQDEVFSLPINQPFLIEKAVIEVPFAAGDSWFKDKTTCFRTLDPPTDGFDFAGPALTIALFNQVKLGDQTRRDTIMTGTITHKFDNFSDIVVSNFPPLDSTYQIRPRGFTAFKAKPGFVIDPVSASNGYSFTGSAGIKCEAQISNGVLVRLEFAMTSSDLNTNRSGVLDVFNSREVLLDNHVTTHYSQSAYIAYINNFGRGGTGFEPSGRSVFGKEFVTSQEVSLRGKVPNPFYLTASNGTLNFNNLSTLLSGAGLSQFAGAITAGNNFFAEAIIPLEGVSQSPYLVMPGDSLVLALSKTRPFCYGNLSSTPFTSGALVHDVQLLTGSINITLYGSLLRENKEFHDTLNQPLSSDAIHEIVIGNEPVLDQFDVEYKESYSGSIADDYITGSLITKTIGSDGRVTLLSGPRGRVFSRLGARLVSPTPTTNQENITNPSKAFRLQPWFERVGGVRHTQVIDYGERFWDSMMPGIVECNKINGGRVFTNPFFQFGNPQKVDLNSIFPYNLDPSRIRMGWFIFDFSSVTALPGFNDPTWTKSYPYEPRYNTVARQIDNIPKSFTTEQILFADPMSAVLTPVTVNGIYVATVGRRNIDNEDLPLSYHWAADVNLSVTNQYGFYTTGSCSNDDLSKILYGFGDVNTLIKSGSEIHGTNHWPSFRDREEDTPSFWGSTYNYKIYFEISPIIRGWKYGVHSGLPTYSNCYFRNGHYGQVRDMLEQRSFTKYYHINEPNTPESRPQGAEQAVIDVKFVDAQGKLTKPENTWSQNLSFEATSSMPYLDGEARNRPSINNNTLNSSILSIKQGGFDNIAL